ncbi:MAG: hypothetical protein PHN88_09260 [Ignavibacteria bacterium]|nr:hypothetical protein [Ignavibacteria bacterium]
MEKFIKATPLFTAALIFMGYWNLHFYYRYFDIQIYDFINTGEVIVSFFPIALETFLWMLVYLLFIMLVIVKPEETESGKKMMKEREFLYNIKTIFNKESYQGDKWYYKLHTFIYKSMNIVAPSFLLMGFVATCIKSFIILKYEINELYKYYGMVIFDIVILYMILTFYISPYIDKQVFRKYNKNIGHITTIAEIIIFFLLVNTLSNLKEATKVLQGKPEYYVTFHYKDSLYTSDSISVFVGKTQNYLFIKNLQSNKNLIFPSDKLENLEMNKTYYPNKIFK